MLTSIICGDRTNTFRYLFSCHGRNPPNQENRLIIQLGSGTETSNELFSVSLTLPALSLSLSPAKTLYNPPGGREYKGSTQLVSQIEGESHLSVLFSCQSLSPGGDTVAEAIPIKTLNLYNCRNLYFASISTIRQKTMYKIKYHIDLKTDFYLHKPSFSLKEHSPRRKSKIRICF